MKFKYVIFGYQRDYFSAMFEEAVSNGIAKYIGDPILDKFKNPFIRTLYKIHHHPLLNWKYKLPLQHLWIPLYYDYSESSPVCFIFLMDWIKNENVKLFLYLRKKYPNCKMGVYFEDLVSSRPLLDMSLLRYLDFGISYDQKDAAKYHLLYHPTFMSKIEIIDSSKPSTDVCFVGMAKDRISKIHKLYQFFTQSGFKTDFVVSKINKTVQKVTGIQYISKDISYHDYLKHVINSNCILEIMHHNAEGYTLRTWEALLYDKKLITNNLKILDAPFYNKEQFIVFNDINDIPVQQIIEPLKKCSFDKSSISSIHFFKYIESQICQ